MKIIVGLGNPGIQYRHTRHNAGFECIDVLADAHGIAMGSTEQKGIVGKGRIGGVPVLLVKPLTYMNLSGECVGALARFYKVAAEDVIVIYDDIDLAPGKLRVRAKGSAGGHNGMKSLIAHLGGQNFPRVRIGVGAKPEGWDLADHVLSHFTAEELPVMEEGTKRAAAAVEAIVSDGVEAAMNRFNCQ